MYLLFAAEMGACELQVEDFGVFVRFLNGLSALCPRSHLADRFVQVKLS